MRRSGYVFAPVLAATAATVLSGCHEGVRHESAAAHAEAAVETRRGGFGASFDGGTVFFILVADSAGAARYPVLGCG